LGAVRNQIHVRPSCEYTKLLKNNNQGKIKLWLYHFDICGSEMINQALIVSHNANEIDLFYCKPEI
jgi:hypothetical protein